MRRVYRNVHIALISAMILTAVAFEAGAVERVLKAASAPEPAASAAESL